MSNQIKYSLAGFCMGVAELIPGISGATVAVIFKIYPNLMKILSNLRIKNLTLNFSSFIIVLIIFFFKWEINCIKLQNLVHVLLF